MGMTSIIGDIEGFMKLIGNNFILRLLRKCILDMKESAVPALKMSKIYLYVYSEFRYF